MPRRFRRNPSPALPPDPPEGSAHFDAVVLIHRPALTSLAGRLALPGMEPEDLVQDVFERAWRARRTLRTDDAALAWLHTILRNRLRDLIRQRRLLESRSAARHPDVISGDPSELVGDAGHGEARVRRCLSVLPPAERAAVVLYYTAGYRIEQVGDVLGCSPAAARKRIQRGRLRLASVLESDAAGPAASPLPAACSHARRLVSGYLDGALSSDEGLELNDHIIGCPHCPVLVQSLVALLRTLGSTSASRLPAPLQADLRSQLGQAG